MKANCMDCGTLYETERMGFWYYRCPECEKKLLDRAGGIASYEASDLEELRKEFYEKFTELQYTQEGKVLFQKYPDDVWSWIVEKLKAR